MSTYREVRKETAERVGRSDDASEALLPCRYCSAPTMRKTLSLLGARCQACYDAYCAQPMATFNATFKRDEPTKALPRKPGFVPQGNLASLLPERPTRERVSDYADELGIDIPAEYRPSTHGGDE